MSGPVLADQPDDWTTPGAHPVVPGVTRIPLPMPHQGLKAVNIYVIDEGDGLTVVDSGWAIPETNQALHSALGSMGAHPADVRSFLITHAHHDHFTAALDLRADHGVPVRLGRGEEPTVRAYQHLRAHHRRTGRVTGIVQVDLLRAHDAPELARAFERVRGSELQMDDSRWELPDGWLDDGDQVDLGGRALQVLATPGHTRGHVVLRDQQYGLLFSGDHVLPHITPSIGFETAPEALPLRSYLDSLQLVRDQPDTLLLPAHGPVGPSVHVRSDELMAHHEQRFADVLTRVEVGDVTAHQVAYGIPWTSRGTRFPDLDVFNQCLAVLETGAHLDVLALEGNVQMSHERGRRIYEPRGSRAQQAG